MEPWVSQEAWIPELPEVEVHQLYRAMDFLLEAHEEIQREVFLSVAKPLNLEVGRHRARHGELFQTTPLATDHKELFALLDLKPPGRDLAIPAPGA